MLVSAVQSISVLGSAAADQLDFRLGRAVKMSCMCNLQVFLVLAVSSNTIMTTFRDPDDGITRARWKRQGKE